MGKLKKIQPNQKSIRTVLTPFSVSGWTQNSGTTLTFTAAQNNPTNGRAFSNLYSSFNLPMLSSQTISYLSTWARNGMSGLTTDNIIVVDVPASTYGELIDGRTMKLKIPMNTGGTMNLYSSYYEPLPMSSDNSTNAEYFGNPVIQGNPAGTPGLASSNVAFLFSDDIKAPSLADTNTNITSWADGWTLGITPTGYAGAGVDNFRFTDTVSSSNTPKAYAQAQDLPVGICYLDKGFAVLTHPLIINNFAYMSGSTGGTHLYPGASSAFTQIHFTSVTSASCEFYSFQRDILMEINILADSGEFYVTENQTAANANSPNFGAGGADTGIQFTTPFGDVYSVWDLTDVTSTYITEIGLYDAQNRLLAIAKPDRPIEKAKNTPTTLQLVLRS